MADEQQERGARIAYIVLAEGTPVATADGQRIGTVRAVRADDAKDVFDGIVISTDDGDRFVDAPEVGDIYERLVLTTLTAEQARELPEPEPGPAIIDVNPGDVTGDDGPARLA